MVGITIPKSNLQGRSRIVVLSFSPRYAQYYPSIPYTDGHYKRSLISADGQYIRAITGHWFSAETQKDYVRIKDGDITYYGGDQGWWENYIPKQIPAVSGYYMAERGCGPTAFANVIAYSIFKNMSSMSDLLKYTDMTRKNWVEGAPFANPLYNKSNFNKTFNYSGSNRDNYAFTKSEYIKFMDYYADMAGIPSFFGMPGNDMTSAFESLRQITGHGYVKYTPSSNTMSSLDTFLINQLNGDVPVLLCNPYFLDSVDKKYLHRELNGVTVSQDPKYHWLTITKYFKKSNEESWVAMSSWGGRYSVKYEVLKRTHNPNYYNAEYAAYKILP